MKEEKKEQTKKKTHLIHLISRGVVTIEFMLDLNNVLGSA